MTSIPPHMTNQSESLPKRVFSNAPQDIEKIIHSLATSDEAARPELSKIAEKGIHLLADSAKEANPELRNVYEGIRVGATQELNRKKFRACLRSIGLLKRKRFD